MQPSLPETLSPTVRTALDDALVALRDLYGDRLRQIVLFGSHARGEAREESDVDVLVVLEGKVNVLKELRRLSHLNIRLLIEHGEAFSFQPYAETDYRAGQHRFLRNVHAEGVHL